MSKSVLVIDTPKSCMRCHFGLIIGNYFFCAITIDKDGVFKQIRNDLYGVKKQDWCPLKPLPEKFDGEKNRKLGDFEPLFKIGWNACINEITGRKC